MHVCMFSATSVWRMPAYEAVPAVHTWVFLLLYILQISCHRYTMCRTLTRCTKNQHAELKCIYNQAAPKLRVCGKILLCGTLAGYA